MVLALGIGLLLQFAFAVPQAGLIGFAVGWVGAQFVPGKGSCRVPGSDVR
ncbi:MAG: hypothetical protein HZB39_17395 [Planctomycetes bacterium]|nr:hypothetical protein [Planctomycetota bacterium]